MNYLSHTRQLLKEYLSEECCRAEIQYLFVSSGFVKLRDAKWRKEGMIEQFYSQREWSQRTSAEGLFPVVYWVLKELEGRCASDIAGGRIYRERFARILVDGVRRDGAEYDSRKGLVSWNEPPRPQASPQHVDLLCVTALLEEHQIATAALREFCEATGTSASDISEYRYNPRGGAFINIAVTSAYEMGAAALGVYVAPLLARLNPRRVVLFGIAAAIDPAAVSLGDVPVASQVVSIDNIAVDDGLEFRTDGFQTDTIVRRRIGRLQTSPEHYKAWQTDCVKAIRTVVRAVSPLRPLKIVCPRSVRPPHIHVGNIAGGPFSLRDADFRDSLTRGNAESLDAKVKVKAAAHPKLLSAEMESHGFMRAAHAAGIPASVIKGISDTGDTHKGRVEAATGGFYRAYACSNAVLAMLHSFRAE